MPKITKIFDLFAEEALANMRDCHVQGNGIETISEATPIYLQRWDKSRPLFSFTYKDENDVIREEAITLLFESELDIEPITPPSFNYLFWLEPKQDDTKVFTFKYVQCGETTPFPHLDIAFDDSTKISLNTPDTERLASRLENAYVFDAGKYKLLFVQQWQNGDQDMPSLEKSPWSIKMRRKELDYSKENVRRTSNSLTNLTRLMCWHTNLSIL